MEKSLNKNSLFIFLFFFSQLYAQETAVPFLNIEPSARANGMAGSFTGLSNNAFSMYYNPAGIVNLEYGSFGYYHYFWYPDHPYPSFLYAAGTFTLRDIGSFGVSYSQMYFGEFEYVDESGNYSGKLTNKEWAISIGYARRISPVTDIGASVKIIKSNLVYRQVGSPGRSNDRGFAVDLGFVFKNFFPGLSYKRDFLNIPYADYMRHRTFSGLLVGISLLNVGPNIEYLGNDNPLPQQLRIGIGWLVMDTDILGLLVTSDFRKYLVYRDKEGSDQFYEAWFTSWKNFSFNEIQFSYGAEFTFFYLIAIRFGQYFPGKNGIDDYWTYGFSVGPEKLQLSWYKVNKQNREDDTWHIGFSIAY